MTQLDKAANNRLSKEMLTVARQERRPAAFIKEGIASGRIVIIKNIRHSIKKICGVGEGLKTKVNANIGTSRESSDINHEIKKLLAAVQSGADTVMDLSTGSKIPQTRRAILNESDIPVGTVPVYQIMVEGINKFGSLKAIPIDFMFDILEEQAKDGVDFFTIHAGLTRQALDLLNENGRVLNIVSRGGALIAKWMIENSKENPFYEHFDRVISICRDYDITLSLGDGLRPGTIHDATDPTQICELATLGDLQKKAHKKHVQVIIEGPGHVPINQVEANILLQKSLCNRAPFYVLGPIVTDVAPGYDHITSAIGGAIAAAAGADFLCYVTPSEHLRLPTLDDVKEGVIASRIAAHAADIAKGVPGAAKWDLDISKARYRRDWNDQFDLALDRSRPEQFRKSSHPHTKDACTMCGEYCSMKISEECF